MPRLLGLLGLYYLLDGPLVARHRLLLDRAVGHAQIITSRVRQGLNIAIKLFLVILNCIRASSGRRLLR